MNTYLNTYLVNKMISLALVQMSLPPFNTVGRFYSHSTLKNVMICGWQFDFSIITTYNQESFQGLGDSAHVECLSLYTLSIH